MRIAINCWVLRQKQLDGIGNFTVETLGRLIRSHPEIKFDILCDKKFSENYFDFPNVTLCRIFPPYRHPVLYVLYFDTVVRWFLHKTKPDIFLSMEGFLSLFTKCPQLPVIYDLNFEHYPKDLKWKNRMYFRTFFKRFAHKATRIATISEYSKQDIVQLYGVRPGKIDNVSCGIKERFCPLTKEEIINTKATYTNGEPYFFFVGSMHPRKNITRLLKAFDIFKKSSPGKYKLVLSGHILWDDESISSVLSSLKFKEDILFTGRVSDEELKFLLGAADCLSFVPTFEGFGLPIVESFQAGVPVICSNTTSMPEVAGNAAIQVDPFNVDEIAGAMMKITSDQELKETLVERGFERTKIFTWDRTAVLLFDCIQKAMKR